MSTPKTYSSDLYGDWEKILKAAHKKKSAVFNKEKNLSEAAKLFHNAGGILDDLGRPADSAQAYAEEADCHVKLGDRYEAGSAYQLASEVLRDADLAKSVEYLLLGARQLEASGQGKKAGRLYKDAGEALMKGPKTEQSTRAAIEAFEKAEAHFSVEGGASSAAECLALMASLHIRLYEFAEAAEAYENAAKTAEKARFSPGRIREYYLRAFFCWMMGKDTAAAGALLESSGSSSAAFGRSREHGFAVKYLRAFVEVDYLKVLDVVDECTTSLNLNPWFNVAFRRLENDLQKTLTETGGDSAAAAVAAENDAAVKEVCGDDDDDDNNDNANENDDDEDFKLTPSSSSKGIHPPKHSDDSDDDGDDLC